MRRKKSEGSDTVMFLWVSEFYDQMRWLMTPWPRCWQHGYEALEQKWCSRDSWAGIIWNHAHSNLVKKDFYAEMKTFFMMLYAKQIIWIEKDSSKCQTILEQWINEAINKGIKSPVTPTHQLHHQKLTPSKPAKLKLQIIASRPTVTGMTQL